MQTMLVKEISSLGTGSLKIWTQTYSANWNLAENNVLCDCSDDSLTAGRGALLACSP